MSDDTKKRLEKIAEDALAGAEAAMAKGEVNGAIAALRLYEQASSIVTPRSYGSPYQPAATA